MDFSRLDFDLASKMTPFSSFQTKQLVTGKAAIYRATLSGTGDVLQGHADITTTDNPNDTAEIRIRTQRKGCILKCNFCFASLMEPGKNLATDEMVYQVIHVFSSRVFDWSTIKRVVISTKGIGEGLVVQDLPKAFLALADLLSKPKFVVSFTGHSAGARVFDQLLELSGTLDVEIEESVHSTDSAWRGRTMLPKSPELLWTVEQMSSRARRWHEATGQKVRTSFGFGPDFASAKFDMKAYKHLFPASWCVPQLTLEAPKDESFRWYPEVYMPELTAREFLLREAGYEVVRFLPEGLTEGGSCGTQFPILK